MLKASQSHNKDGFREVFEQFHAHLYRFIEKHADNEEQAIKWTAEILEKTWRSAAAEERSDFVRLEKNLFSFSKKIILDHYRRKIVERSKYDFILQQTKVSAPRNQPPKHADPSTEPEEKIHQASP